MKNFEEFVAPVIAGVVMAILVCFLTREGDWRSMSIAILACLTTMIFSLMIQIRKMENKINNLSERK